MRRLVGIPPIHGYESPASWLTRAALSQGVEVKELMTYVGLPVKRDPDLTLAGNALWNVANLTGQAVSSFGFAEHMFSGVRSIDPTGEDFLLWTKNGMPRYRYCSSCLHEPGCKHFPLHWRFKAWRWCPIHDCLLGESCPHCRCDLQLPGDMLNAGLKREGVAHLGHCLQCAERLDTGWDSTPHPLKEGLVAGWEKAVLENGRALLAAIFHRHFFITGNAKRHSLDSLTRFKKMGVLPHDLLLLSNQSLQVRRNQRKATSRNHPGFYEGRSARERS
ncbi:TniQ family protein [Comamonas testosteroni]|uniref:TniQ family protein n=1 Tax=Comamonas testosteroni TaxID=285 RepID=UPI0015FBA832|nr:TniQ family protein [Comamonas testosteroni]